MTKKTRRAKARRALLTLSLVLVMMMVAVGGTIAWLTDNTENVVNTFTTSDVDIWMTETVGGAVKNTDIDGSITNPNFQIIPGGTEIKNPAVVVEDGSEASWVFVQVTEDGGEVTVDGKITKFSDFITWEIDSSKWQPVPGTEGVYYHTFDEKLAADLTLNVLADTEVVYPQTVTKAMLNALEEAGEEQKPTLTFKAWIIQKDNLADGDTPVNSAAGAWAIVNP